MVTPVPPIVSTVKSVVLDGPATFKEGIAQCLRARPPGIVLAGINPELLFRHVSRLRQGDRVTSIERPTCAEESGGRFTRPDRWAVCPGNREHVRKIEGNLDGTVATHREAADGTSRRSCDRSVRVVDVLHKVPGHVGRPRRRPGTFLIHPVPETTLGSHENHTAKFAVVHQTTGDLVDAVSIPLVIAPRQSMEKVDHGVPHRGTRRMTTWEGNPVRHGAPKRATEKGAVLPRTCGHAPFRCALWKERDEPLGNSVGIGRSEAVVRHPPPVGNLPECHAIDVVDVRGR